MWFRNQLPFPSFFLRDCAIDISLNDEMLSSCSSYKKVVICSTGTYLRGTIVLQLINHCLSTSSSIGREINEYLTHSFSVNKKRARVYVYKCSSILFFFFSCAHIVLWRCDSKGERTNSVRVSRWERANAPGLRKEIERAKKR